MDDKKENVLEINYFTDGGDGKMIIWLDGYFPKNKRQFNNFMKFIKTSSSSFKEDPQEIRGKLKRYFNRQVEYHESQFKDSGKLYFHYDEKFNEIDHQVSAGKYPSGLYIPKEDLKQMKSQLKYYKSLRNDYLKDAKAHKKKLEYFKYFVERMD